LLAQQALDGQFNFIQAKPYGKPLHFSFSHHLDKYFPNKMVNKYGWVVIGNRRITSKIE
jgi:hypothetical protein